MGRAYSVRKESIEKSGKQKGKLYTNYAKEIYVVAKRGTPDLEVNLELKRLVEKAKRLEIPNDIINRAIDKAKGNTGESLEEITYEGFGPGASTFIIKCLTDNVHRTVGMVRAAFNKVNKSLGVTNSVSYNYDFLGVLAFNYYNEDEILDHLITNNIDLIDIENEDSEITIYFNPNDMNNVKNTLEKLIPNIEYSFDEIGMFAKEEITLENEELEEFNKLYNLLEDIDDVNTIYHNVKVD